jgi:hypothetical protein
MELSRRGMWSFYSRVRDRLKNVIVVGKEIAYGNLAFDVWE